MLIDLRLKILNLILKVNKNYFLDPPISAITIGEQDFAILMIPQISKWMLIADNRDYYSEIKETER
jgi:hypothetical protein